MQGDDSPLLVTRRACFTPCKSEGKDWLQSSIFQNTFTIRGKVCKLVIDSGSCENVVSEEVVQKLGLQQRSTLTLTNYLGSKRAMR